MKKSPIMRRCVLAVTFAGTALFPAVELLADTFVETYAQAAAVGADGLAIDVDGNIYTTNYLTGVVGKLTPAKVTSTVVSDNNEGSAGLTFDSEGNMFIGMYASGNIRKVTPEGVETNYVTGLRGPIGLDFDSAGNLYVANYFTNPTITKITPDGTKIDFAQISQLENNFGEGVSSVAVDDEDNVYVVAYSSSDVYKISPAGDVSLFASIDSVGFGFIQFHKGNFYLSSNSNRIIHIDLNGNWSVFAGTGEVGSTDGPALSAKFNSPNGLAISADGNSIFTVSNVTRNIRRTYTVEPEIELVAPYFTSTAVVTVQEGNNYSYTLVAEDPNGDSLSYTVTTIPTWLSFDGVDTISGTPGSNEAGNSYQITAAVNDGSGLASVDQAFSVRVTSIPDSPTSSGGGSFGQMLILLLLVSLTRKYTRRQNHDLSPPF